MYVTKDVVEENMGGTEEEVPWHVVRERNRNVLNENCVEVSMRIFILDLYIVTN